MSAVATRIDDDVDESAGRALLIQLRARARDLQAQVWNRKVRAALTTGPARTLPEEAVVALVPGISAAMVRQWRTVAVMTRPTPPRPDDRLEGPDVPEQVFQLMPRQDRRGD